MEQQIINNGDSGLLSRTKINGNFDRLNGSVNGNINVGFDAGVHETGSNKFFITSLTSAQQVDEATARTKAIIYGIQSATTGNQELIFNAKVGIGRVPINKLDVQIASGASLDVVTRFGGSGNGDTGTRGVAIDLEVPGNADQVPGARIAVITQGGAVSAQDTDLVFYAAKAGVLFEAMRLDEDGNAGIGGDVTATDFIIA